MGNFITILLTIILVVIFMLLGFSVEQFYQQELAIAGIVVLCILAVISSNMALNIREWQSTEVIEDKLDQLIEENGSLEEKLSESEKKYEECIKSASGEGE